MMCKRNTIELRDLGYTDFKLKNGQIVYEVEGEKLFKIKAPEGTEIESKGYGYIENLNRVKKGKWLRLLRVV